MTKSDTDPLDGQEVALLNSMLAGLRDRIKAGDDKAIDQAIKILELKRKYKRDRWTEDQD